MELPDVVIPIQNLGITPLYFRLIFFARTRVHSADFDLHLAQQKIQADSIPRL